VVFLYKSCRFLRIKVGTFRYILQKNYKEKINPIGIMAKIMITVQGYRCERCNHEWIPRIKVKEDPVICPKCKSPYWNKPKKRKK